MQALMVNVLAMDDQLAYRSRHGAHRPPEQRCGSLQVQLPCRMDKRSHRDDPACTGMAALILVSLIVGLTIAFVLGLFIWAAVKDGEEDQALQTRLGIRRRTRLGR